MYETVIANVGMKKLVEKRAIKSCARHDVPDDRT